MCSSDLVVQKSVLMGCKVGETDRRIDREMDLPEEIVSKICNMLPKVRGVSPEFKREIERAWMLRDLKRRCTCWYDEISYSWKYVMSYEECVNSYNYYNDTGILMYEMAPWSRTG